MKQLLLLLAFLPFSFPFFAGMNHCSAQSGKWDATNPMPTASAYLTATVYKDKIYVFGGLSSPSTTLNTYYSFDLVTETWAFEGYLPKYIMGAGAETIGDTIYLIGGGQSNFVNYYNSVYAFNPVNKTWAERKNMPTARNALTTSVLNGKIHVICGIDLTGVHEMFDPATNNWFTLAPYPKGLGSPASCVLDGKIYVIGGTAGDPWMGEDYVSFYDTLKNSWKPATHMDKPRWGLVAETLNGKIYAIGGVSAPDLSYSDVEVFDPGTGLWTTGTPMQTDRRAFASVVYNGRIYVLGGISQSTVQMSVEKYTPAPYVPVQEPGLGGQPMPLLHQNVPNPFTQQTTICYEVADAGIVDVSIYNLRGQLQKTLVHGRHAPGAYTVDANSAGLEAGVYQYVIRTETGQPVSKKMVILNR